MVKSVLILLVLTLLLFSVATAAPVEDKGFFSFFDSFINWLTKSSSPTAYVVEDNSNVVDLVPTGPVPIGCSDTDDGADFSTKGFLYYSDIDGDINEMFDHCIGDNLVEYYCDGNTFATKVFTCERSCYNGACIPLTLGDDKGNAMFEWVE